MHNAQFLRERMIKGDSLKRFVYDYHDVRNKYELFTEFEIGYESEFTVYLSKIPHSLDIDFENSRQRYRNFLELFIRNYIDLQV